MVMLGCIIYMFLASSATQLQTGASAPDALVRLYESRARLTTAEVDWSRHQFEGPKFQTEHTKFYTSRLSAKERALYSRGDEEGVVTRDSEGGPSKVHPGSYMSFEGPDGVFDRWDGEHEANWMPKGSARWTPDLRTLGTLPWFCYDDIHDAMWKDPGETPLPRSYSESTEGALRVVTATRAGAALTWWIDPQRGWQATRVTFSRDGVIEKEARIALAKFGEHWLPQSVMYFSNGYKNGTEPCDVTTIDKAVFNDPRQPQVLSPADIGVTPRMFVWLKDNTMKKVGTGTWNGARITGAHFFPGMGPGVQLVQQALEKAAPAAATSRPATPDSQWEAYTRRFIERYRLTDDQVEAALQILKNAQDQAQSYLTRHAEEFEKLRADEAILRAAGEPEGSTRQAALRERRAKLHEPIDEIFEKQLKARLEKLPTRKQRAAAEGVGPTTERSKR
jgi:hypothetical protein